MNNKGYIIFLTLISFLILPLACNETISPEEELTVDQLKEDPVFQSFAKANEDLVNPILEENKSSEFVEKLEKEISYVDNLQESADESDYKEIITLMGYENIEQYKSAYSNAVNAFEKLKKKYPDLKQLDEANNKKTTILNEALADYHNIRYINSSTTVRYKCENPEQFNSCMEDAQSDFYWGTAGCVAGGLAGCGPIGGAACQAVVVANHEYDKQECAEDNC